MKIEAETLKQEIYNYLNLTDDVEILTKVKGFFSEQSKTDWWDDLSYEQKEMIRIGSEQADNGQMIPHEVVLAKVKKLFSKYE
jgi:hypothetical protein